MVVGALSVSVIWATELGLRSGLRIAHGRTSRWTSVLRYYTATTNPGDQEEEARIAIAPISYLDDTIAANADLAGGSKQKGIIYYGVSANRQNPFAGAGHDAVFNIFRRTKNQIFFWLPTMVAGYYIVQWANERYVLSPPKATRSHLEIHPDRTAYRLKDDGADYCVFSNEYLNSKAGRAEFADAEE